MAPWNVLTLSSTGYKTALVKEVTRYKSVITRTTETSLPQSHQIPVAGAIFLHTSGPPQTQGVVIRQPLAQILTTWNPISPCLLYAWLQLVDTYFLLWPMCRITGGKGCILPSASSKNGVSNATLLVVGAFNAMTGCD